MNTPFCFDQRNLDLSSVQSSHLGRLRVGQWRVQAPRGQVVVLPGRGDFLEKYTPLAVHLNAGGYSVTSLEWPGQGASRRLGRHPQAGHIASYDDYVAALHQCLLKTELIDQPTMWLAYSMGAPTALRTLLEHAYDVSRLVLISPAFGFAELPEGLIRILTGVANTLGLSERFALGETPTDPSTWTLESSQVSSDPAAFAAFRNFLTSHPSYLVGGSTWGWVEASLEVFAQLQRADLSSLRMPVLLLSAENELTVSVKAQKRLVQRLPNAKFTTLPGKHDLLLSHQEVVESLFERVEAFFSSPQNSDSGRSR